MLGAGVAGAGIVLAVLGTMGLLTSRDNGVSAVDARLAGLELEVRDLAAVRPRPASMAAPWKKWWAGSTRSKPRS